MKRFLSLLLICIILVTSQIHPFQGQLPTLTEEDQKMIAQLDQEINQFVASLPPEAQQQFWQDVEKLSEEMSKMSPEELDSFIEKAFGQGIMPEEMPAPTVTPPVTPTPEVPQAPVTPKPQPAVDEITPIVNMIDALIEQGQGFLKKGQLIPDLAGKVESWATQKTLTPWKEGTTWNKMQQLIEELIQKLYKLKDRDSISKQYKYIPTLITNKPLVNALNVLDCTVCPLIPQVELPALPDATLSKTSARAIEKILGAFAQFIFVTNGNEELEKVFTAYGTTAQQIKQSHQTLEERARQSSKGTARTATATGSTYRAGRPSSSGDNAYNDNFNPSYSNDSYNYPSRSARSMNENDFGSPSSNTSSTGYSSGIPSSRGKAGSSTPASSSSTDKTGAPAPTTPAAPTVVQEDAIADKYLDEATNQLESATDTLNVHKDILSDLKNHLTNKDAVNTDFALTTLPQTTKQIQKAADKISALQQRTNRLKAPKLKEKYAQQFKTDASLKKILASLEDTAKSIEAIKSDWDSLNKKISSDKQYAYFGGINASAADQKLTTTIAQPSSLYDLAHAIRSLQKAIKGLGK